MLLMSPVFLKSAKNHSHVGFCLYTGNSETFNPVRGKIIVSLQDFDVFLQCFLDNHTSKDTFEMV
jgi:hypothetical protein